MATDDKFMESEYLPVTRIIAHIPHWYHPSGPTTIKSQQQWCYLHLL